MFWRRQQLCLSAALIAALFAALATSCARSPRASDPTSSESELLERSAAANTTALDEGEESQPRIEPNPSQAQTPDSPSPSPQLDVSKTYERGYSWPVDFVFPPQLDTQYITPIQGEAGELRVEHVIVTKDLDGVARVWRQALKDAGYVEAPSCASVLRHVSCVVSRTEGASTRLGRLDARIHPQADDRVVVSMQLYPHSHPVLKIPPGECVIPPLTERGFSIKVDARDEDGEPFGYVAGYTIGPSDVIDLDGDGQLDRLVPQATSGECPRDLRYDVYLMRGACGHRLGSITGSLSDTSHVAPFSHGIRSLSTEERWATPRKANAAARGAASSPVKDRNGHHRVRQYRFNGTSLRKTSDKDETAPCRHCGIGVCSQTPASQTPASQTPASQTPASQTP